MRAFRLFIFLFILLGRLHFVLAAQDDYVEDLPQGAKMDWSNLELSIRSLGSPPGRIKVLDDAYPLARKDAEEKAQTKFLQTLSLIRISELETLGALMKHDAKLKNLVEKEAHQFKVVDSIYYSNGTLELILKMPLHPVLAHLFEMKENSPAKIPVKKKGRKVYSGLIVDTSGLVYYPVLAPKLLAEDGLELYGSKNVRGDAMLHHGVVRYSRSVKDAKEGERMGSNPLVVKALRLGADNALVLPSYESLQLRQSELNLLFLEEGNVIIVIPADRS